MFTVELYAKIRHAVMIVGLSRREAAKRFGIHRNTITKMLSFSVPPGYRRRERPASRKLGPFMAWIDAILESDRSVHKKQRHTAHRIFERLRDERGFTGGYTIVREYVAAEMLRTREMFVPLSHRPGHAQADFGEADGYIGGKKVRFHYFCVDLPHSDGCFVKAYPAETAEAFCDGHVAAFDFFGGVPQSILYDNTKLAVAKIVKGGRRLRSKMFAELLQKHLNTVKLLIVDELGYVPFTAVGSELLFEVFSQRYERGSTLVTSNLPFDEWTSIFGSERLTGALLDRLTHHVHILEMNGQSYRLATSKKAQPRSAQGQSQKTKIQNEGEPVTVI